MHSHRNYIIISQIVDGVCYNLQVTGESTAKPSVHIIHTARVLSSTEYTLSTLFRCSRCHCRCRIAVVLILTAHIRKNNF